MTYALTWSFSHASNGIGHAPSSHIAAYVLLMCVCGGLGCCAWQGAIARTTPEGSSISLHCCTRADVAFTLRNNTSHMCPDRHFAQAPPSQKMCLSKSEQNGSLGLCEAIVRQGSLVVVDREVVVDVAIDVVVVNVDRDVVVVVVDADRDVVVVVDSTALLLCRPLMLLLLTSTGMLLLLLTLTAMLLLTLTGMLLLLLLTVLPCCCAVGCRTNWRSSTWRT